MSDDAADIPKQLNLFESPGEKLLTKTKHNPISPKPIHSKSNFEKIPVSIKNIVSLYSPMEWEEFIEEFVMGLDPNYFAVKHLGGTGDKGLDVVGFETEHGFEGTWDCFQCKRYKNSLSWTEVFPEMLKMFNNVVDGEYILPSNYFFVSPKGISTDLNRFFSQPTKCRDKFIKELSAKNITKHKIDIKQLREIKNLVSETDFSMFKSKNLLDVLDIHQKTKYFSQRFKAELPNRSEIQKPTKEILRHESRYIYQLFEVYMEKYPESNIVKSELNYHAKTKEHFHRQRVRFLARNHCSVILETLFLTVLLSNCKKIFFPGLLTKQIRNMTQGIADLVVF